MKSRTAQGAKMLAGRYYTDEAILKKEQARIFERSWLYVERVQAIPIGGYVLREVMGENLLLMRDTEGEVRVFYNVCRHRGARVCREEGGEIGAGVRCSYHAWTYGADGRLLGAPNMHEVAGFRREDYGLVGVATAVWEGFVFINFADEPQPFREAYAPLWDKFKAWELPSLVSVHQTVYEVKANWKLLFQNYSECYHCPTVHPVLNKLTPYRDSYNDLEEGPFLGGPMLMAGGAGSSMTMSGRLCALPLAGVAGEQLGLVYYYTLMPRMFLSLHPDYVLVHRGEVLGVDRTRVVCEWLFAPEAVAEADFDPSGAIEFWDMTNRQDWELCEISQAGVGSRGYRPGPYAELESQLAAFDREYLRIMEEVDDG
ncbi:MAG TPA: aromatic ring-hydroxylating dioxygenase subunit alpha [Anaerolineae bacterium]|nr:aromatic ring-hydroxylating dioxygenase subunit alpha [Anaerolineae bacterium]